MKAPMASPSSPEIAICVRHLFISPGHNFFGHKGQPPGTHPIQRVDALECVPGRGIRGDRFFDYRPDYPGQITFFAEEVFAALCAELGVANGDPAALRRNVIVRGLDLNALIGREFTLQGVRFAAKEECRPCFWMNGAVHPQAEAWLKGRGGLRAAILTPGWLRREFSP